MTQLWVLGAADPEMEAIEALLRECGETVVHALDARGERVRAGNAYRAECPPEVMGGLGERLDAVYCVECSWADPSRESLSCVVAIDHHRPGDPGFGCPPSDFFAASSLGQVLTVLGVAVLYAHRDDSVRVLAEQEGNHGWMHAWSGIGRAHARVMPGANRWPAGKYGLWEGGDLPAAVQAMSLDPGEAMLVAAADHCLAAAYRGECPGVAPDALMRWRVASRARFQGCSEADILADIERARALLAAAPWIELESIGDMVHTCEHDWTSSVCDGCARDPIRVRDMRSPVPVPVPELVEAACRYGYSYLSGPLVGTDNRLKYTVSGSADEVSVWLELWAPRAGLIDLYGDPARGFAGGYSAAADMKQDEIARRR